MNSAIEYRENANIPGNGAILDTIPVPAWTISTSVKHAVLQLLHNISQQAIELQAPNTEYIHIRQLLYKTLYIEWYGIG